MRERHRKNVYPNFNVLQLWATFDLLRYSRQVCLEICEHLHIELFRIRPPADKERNGTVRAGAPQPRPSLARTRLQ
jgi:hypothetical protein